MWKVRLPQRLQRVWVLFRLLPAWGRRGWVEAKAQQLHSRHQVHHDFTDPQWLATAGLTEGPGTLAGLSHRSWCPSRQLKVILLGAAAVCPVAA